ncbi:MAG: phosphate signaling complex protein PhoU [Clostridiales bacterium]|nr:phosphate signaling complex protein PhoU [Clostridiales bacterium]
MRNLLDDKLEKAHEMLLIMCSLVEENINMAMKALINQDLDLADKVIDNDELIDSYEENIEDLCIELIATQNPLGSDLRKIFTMQKIISDLERIGDHSENIAEIVKQIGEQELIKPLIDIPEMAKIAIEMVHDCINMYIDGNVELSIETIKRDDEVDRLYEEIYSDLIELFNDNKEYKDQIFSLLLIGMNLERIADHATNICERAYYMVEGERVEL